jgi:Na+-transporting methylmalonyl-CoA/oxaloacetate decarboxylase gamma subunit
MHQAQLLIIGMYLLLLFLLILTVFFLIFSDASDERKPQIDSDDVFQ